MRILHTSDWHLGIADNEYSLYDDQIYFIDEICSVAEKKNVDAVIIAGDVFDRSVASSDAIKLYDYAMTGLCIRLKKKVLIIAGNHDSAERLSSCSALLSSAGLHICGALSYNPSKTVFDDTDIYMIPWITEEKVKSIFPEDRELINSLEDAYSVVTNHIRQCMDTSKRNILVSHAFISDAETSESDKSAEIGFAAQVSSAVFDGFDYVALGHLHKPQSVNERIRYSGTPMPYSFGREETQKKSVTIIDTSDMSFETVPLKQLHLRRSFSGTLDELLEPSLSEEEKNGYVKLNVTDKYIGPDTRSRLESVYPNLRTVSGKTYDGDDTSVSLTMEQFEKMESDSVEVFRYFCREEADIEPDDRMTDLFRQAMLDREENRL